MHYTSSSYYTARLSTYDLLSQLVLALLSAKIFFQKLWSENLVGIKVKVCSYELHMFSDASREAFACCAYLVKTVELS